ncbi:MAG TPA: hypothetical protein VGF92_02070 [Stellaceae bacterium]|jgi:hypothetical protein
MSTIDAGANVSRSDGSIGRAVTPRHRLGIGNILGGFLLTGMGLALSAAAFPLAAVYSFIWWAEH